MGPVVGGLPLSLENYFTSFILVQVQLVPFPDYSNSIQTGLTSQWCFRASALAAQSLDDRRRQRCCDSLISTLVCTWYSYLPTVFSQQSHVAGVGAPHHVLDLGDLDGGQRALLLHVEQRDAVGIAQQQRACPSIEDFLAAWHLNLLHNFILEVLNQQLQKEKEMLLDELISCQMTKIIIKKYRERYYKDGSKICANDNVQRTTEKYLQNNNK